MIDLSNFKLMKEDEHAYSIQHPNGKALQVSKKGMSEKAHALIKKLKPMNNYAEGDVVQSQPATEMIQSAQAPQSNVPGDSGVSASQPAPQSTGTPVEQTMSIQDRAFQAEKDAEQEKANALTDQGKAEAGTISKGIAQLEGLKQQNDIVDEYRQKDQKLLDQYQSQKIDPDRYWHQQETPAKIASGIALILGGLGSGLTHGRNMAQDMIENAISRDIDAQKNDQSKSYNLYQMNRAAMGDDLSANLATQNQMLTALKYKLLQSGALTGGKLAQANADQAIAVINQKQEMNNQQLGLIRQGLGMGPGGGGPGPQDPSMLVPRLVPPEQQKTVFGEIERAQNTKRQYKGIVDAFDKASTDVRPMSGGALKNAIPGITSPFVKAFHAEMGPTFQNLEGTVRQAAMDNMDKNLTPQLGDSDETIAVKRNALQNYLNSAVAAPTAKGYGIDISKFGSTSVPRPQESLDQQARDWAKANPNDPRAAKILQKSGLR